MNKDEYFRQQQQLFDRYYEIFRWLDQEHRDRVSNAYDKLLNKKQTNIGEALGTACDQIINPVPLNGAEEYEEIMAIQKAMEG